MTQKTSMKTVEVRKFEGFYSKIREIFDNYEKEGGNKL
jgi:hypothetical protein